MELFHELQNRQVRAVVRAVNRICRDGYMTRAAFIRFLRENGCAEPEYVADWDLFVWSEENGLRKNENDRPRGSDLVSLRIPAEIPVLPSDAECAWMKAMLRHRTAELILSRDEIDELLRALNDTPDIAPLFYEKSLAADRVEYTKEYKRNFRLLMKAIREQRSVSFVNEAKSMGESVQNENCIPYKLEYSIPEEVFRFIFYNPHEDRPIKANLARICGLTIGNPVATRKYADIYTLVHERRAPEPLILRVRNIMNAPERAILLFSQYSLETSWLKDVDTWGDALELKIHYYVFDENDIVNKILLFGPYMEAVSPASVREKILDKLILT
jgi:hypothetical protein